MSRDGESAPPTGGAERWQLTQTKLNSLLYQLDSDPRAAADSYRQIHQRLTRFFEWQGLGDRAEDLADRTLDRVAGKVRSGLQIQSDDPYHYISRVARFIVHEARRSQRRQLAARPPTATFEPPPEPFQEADDPRLVTLEACLQQLSVDERHLIRAYYGADGPQRSASRQHLAQRLGISTNSLRIRAHRIRKRLESCIQKENFEPT